MNDLRHTAADLEALRCEQVGRIGLPACRKLLPARTGYLPVKLLTHIVGISRQKKRLITETWGISENKGKSQGFSERVDAEKCRPALHCRSSQGEAMTYFSVLIPQETVKNQKICRTRWNILMETKSHGECKSDRCILNPRGHLSNLIF